MGGINTAEMYESLQAPKVTRLSNVIEKFKAFEKRMKAEAGLLEQEIHKCIAQMDFEHKNEGNKT